MSFLHLSICFLFLICLCGHPAPQTVGIQMKGAQAAPIPASETKRIMCKKVSRTFAVDDRVHTPGPPAGKCAVSASVCAARKGWESTVGGWGGRGQGRG